MAVFCPPDGLKLGRKQGRSETRPLEDNAACAVFGLPGGRTRGRKSQTWALHGRKLVLSQTSQLVLFSALPVGLTWAETRRSVGRFWLFSARPLADKSTCAVFCLPGGRTRGRQSQTWAFLLFSTFPVGLNGAETRISVGHFWLFSAVPGGLNWAETRFGRKLVLSQTSQPVQFSALPVGLNWAENLTRGLFMVGNSSSRRQVSLCCFLPSRWA